MAQSRAEEVGRTTRRNLVRALAVGAGAIGVPTLLNRVVARRAHDLPDATWGSGDVYSWRHGDIAYQRLGEGAPIVLVHSLGIGHSSAEWRRVAEELDRDFEIFAPDLLGWGLSAKTPTAYDADLYVQLLRDFVDEVVGRRVTLVAAGLPAAFAVQAAAERPRQITALGLVTPMGLGFRDRGPGPLDIALHQLLRLPVLGTSALHLLTRRGAIARTLRDDVYAESDLVDDRLVDLHYTHAHRPGAHRALRAWLSGYLDLDVRRALERLEQPVWMAWGRCAACPAVESADLWLRRIDRATLEVFERTGMLPHAESPSELARKLERWLLDI